MNLWFSALFLFLFVEEVRELRKMLGEKTCFRAGDIQLEIVREKVLLVVWTVLFTLVIVVWLKRGMGIIGNWALALATLAYVTRMTFHYLMFRKLRTNLLEAEVQEIMDA